MARTYSQLRFHVVFATKGRPPSIEARFEEQRHRYILGILENRGAQLLAIGGMPDHIHLLIGLKPIQAIAEMVKEIKGSSSRWINEEFSAATPFEWQAGYAAYTVSESRVSAVKRYIARQKEHHHSQSFEAEGKWLLKKHNVEVASP